jgi:alkyl sulfatase BDS1-like metallo-beta-lactamase superfamily hydrolase
MTYREATAAAVDRGHRRVPFRGRLQPLWSLDVDLGDLGVRYRLTLRNGALTYTVAPQSAEADGVLRLTSTTLAGLLADGVGPEQFAAAGVQVDADVSAVGRLLGALDEPDPAFAIVIP